jgi:CheY-like chemotaxis protein
MAKSLGRSVHNRRITGLCGVLSRLARLWTALRFGFSCIASNTRKGLAPSVTKTVLIADDSFSMRLSVRLLLEGRHPELVVHEAVDGLDAIEKAKKSKPDLIILDLAMPRLNGAEAATVLKNDLPETPVILFTLTDLRPNSLCEAIGVDFISKVDGIPKLLERVDALFPPNNASATLSA